MPEPAGDDVTTGGDRSSDGSEASRRAAVPGWLRVVAVVAALAVVGGGAYLLGQRGGDETATTGPTPTGPTTTLNPDDATTDPTPSGPTTTLDPDDVVDFTDPESGLSLSYPSDWTELEIAPDADTVRLVLSAGGLDSLLVRVVPIETEIVTPEDFVDIKAVTDDIVQGADITILEQSAVEVDGMPGYYYLYQFTDTSTGERGVHAHYFLFRGRAMHILVFQAVPASNFAVLAPLFDAIASSVTVDPPGDEGDDEGDATTTTTADDDEENTTTTTDEVDQTTTTAPATTSTTV